MKSVICTLYEGSYHFGVGALVNSLYHHQFRGDFVVGYRGELPPWAKPQHKIDLLSLGEADLILSTEGFRLIFVQLQTDEHLTNHKPKFMIDLLEAMPGTVDAIYYFDPDICVTQAWSLFEEWVSCGVALCEDVNSPLSQNHPRRVGWRRYYKTKETQLSFKTAQYVNGGFVGLKVSDLSFLKTWRQLMLWMGESIGGLGVTNIGCGQQFENMGFFSCFDRSDQDGLNATLEAFEGEVSVMGQEAMAFKPGNSLLPHAVGFNKPWLRRYWTDALCGAPPRLVDKAYWQYAEGLIPLYPSNTLIFKRLSMRLALLLARFYKKN